MEFFFDEPTAAHAAALLLQRHGGRMPYVKLVKLLYLADREALVETGAPITGDRFASMQHGPALCRVLELIEDENPAPGSAWRDAVRRERFDAVLACFPEGKRLSEYAEGVLEGVSASCGRLEESEVVARTQALPEWSDPGPGERAVPIDPADVMRHAGLSEADVEDTADQAEAVRSLRTSLARMARAK